MPSPAEYREPLVPTPAKGSDKQPPETEKERPPRRGLIAGLARTLLWAASASRERILWSLLSVLTDAFTICVSIADIVTDVLVCSDFHRSGYKSFFNASIAVFVLAQCCYAFLFVASYAGDRRPLARCAIFLAVLPFAQLVPLFTWLEALHLPAVDRCMQRWGLRPTSAAAPAGESASSGGGSGDGRGGEAGDTLWGFVQSKYQSHAGFLVEAFVEAVPQAVLQTLFVVMEHQGTALNAASVGISIFTVASKGYLLSYALDYLTFAFNFGCVAADCLGLFAIATALAATGARGALGQMVTSFASSGLALSVLGGFALLWFTITDDHLKLRMPKIWPRGVRGTASVFFDLYIVRLSAWFLAIVPCLVLFGGARLSLVPICVLKSIDPDLLRHARFFRGLMHFLRGKGGGSDDARLRLWTVNTFVARARRNASDLCFSLRARGSSTSADTVFKKWLSGLFAPKAVFRPTQPSWTRSGAAPSASDDEDAGLQQALLDSLGDGTEHGSGFAAMATMAFRRSRAAMWLRQTVRHVRWELAARSEVFRAGLGCRESSLADLLLRIVAWCAVVLCVVCAAPLALGHTALIGLSIVYPLAHVASLCGAEPSASEVTLPCGLTASYVAALGCLAIMLPFVIRRQMLWMDLVDLHGLPDEFYGGAVLVEIRKRHLRDSMLRQRVGHYLTGHVLSFLEK